MFRGVTTLFVRSAVLFAGDQSGSRRSATLFVQAECVFRMFAEHVPAGGADVLRDGGLVTGCLG